MQILLCLLHSVKHRRSADAPITGSTPWVEPAWRCLLKRQMSACISRLPSMHQNWGCSAGCRGFNRRYPAGPRLIYCLVGNPTGNIHSFKGLLTASKVPAYSRHSNPAHYRLAASRAQQQCRSQLAVSRLQWWELADSLLLPGQITLPVVTPKKLRTLQKSTSSSRTSSVQVQTRQWHACMADASLVHVHKPHVDGN